MVEGARPAGEAARAAVAAGPEPCRHGGASIARAYADTVPGVPPPRAAVRRGSARALGPRRQRRGSRDPLRPRRRCRRRSHPAADAGAGQPERRARRHLARLARLLSRDRRRREVRRRQHPLCAAPAAGRRPSGFRCARWRAMPRRPRRAAGRRGTARLRGGADWACPARAHARKPAGPDARARPRPARPGSSTGVRSQAIDADAAGPLRALFTHWADSPVQLRFAGTEQLLTVLAEATPASDRGVDVVWWQLRMAALRVMHRADEFELAGAQLLHHLRGVAAALGGSAAAATVPPMNGAKPPPQLGHAATLAAESSRDAGAASCGGRLVGESLLRPGTPRRGTGRRRCPPCPARRWCASISRRPARCSNWVADHEAQGQRVEFVDAHRLVAAFFGVIGIADHANVSPRSE